MTQSTAQIVSQMLEVHYHKSREGYFGGKPSGNALKLMDGGLLQDYLNESGPQGLVREFDSALTWATPTNCRDRLLILNCAATADILPDDEPDQLSWRSVKTRDPEAVEAVTLTRQPGAGFGFSLVTIERSVYVRRVQPFSAASSSGKIQEGDRVLSVCDRDVNAEFNQNQIIQMLKKEGEVELTLSHVNFDGKGCPETTYDRNSPLQSPALESSYKLALDLSSGGGSPGGTSNGSENNSIYRNNGMSSTGCDSLVRGNLRADNVRTGNEQEVVRKSHRYSSVGSVGDSMSTSSSHEVALTHSSSGSDPTSPRYTQSSPASSNGRYHDTTPVTRADNNHEPRTSLTSSISSHSSVNKDFYRDSAESIPISVQSLGSTEYIVLPNHGKGIGIGISGKRGVIIRNILQGSIADKDGRLQIGDHILQVNSIKCTNLGQSETKEIIIPELRRSTPTVKLLVQHASKRLRTPSSNAPSSTGSTPSKSGPGSTLPVQKHADQGQDLLLPEALWSSSHPASPIAYRFGTVILPAPAWIKWSQEKHFVTLTRLANGFGFSIMDYKDEKQKGGVDNSSVLIIRQITPFGAADLEGHLALGERIISVNGEPITNHSIQDIVSIIKPCSVLQIKMCKPVKSDSWKSLLNADISAIPLVSGPKSITRANSMEGVSTSTLNVTRASSYQSVNSESSMECRNYNHQPIIRHPTGRKTGSSEENMTRPEPEPDHVATSRDLMTSSRGVSSRYEPTDNQHSRSGSADTTSSSRQEGGTLRRRYQPASAYTEVAHHAIRNNATSDYVKRLSEGVQDSNVIYQGARYPRPPEPQPYGAGRVKSPDVRRQRYIRPNHQETTFNVKERYNQETTFEAKRSHSSGSNSEIQSIASSVSGINNKELADLWKQRGNKTSQQLSRV